MLSAVCVSGTVTVNSSKFVHHIAIFQAAIHWSDTSFNRT